MGRNLIFVTRQATSRYDSGAPLREHGRANLLLAARIRPTRYDVGGLLSNPTMPDLLLATWKPAFRYSETYFSIKTMETFLSTRGDLLLDTTTLEYISIHHPRACLLIPCWETTDRYNNETYFPPSRRPTSRYGAGRLPLHPTGALISVTPQTTSRCDSATPLRDPAREPTSRIADTPFSIRRRRATIPPNLLLDTWKHTSR